MYACSRLPTRTPCPSISRDAADCCHSVVAAHMKAATTVFYLSVFCFASDRTRAVPKWGQPNVTLNCGPGHLSQKRPDCNLTVEPPRTASNRHSGNEREDRFDGFIENSRFCAYNFRTTSFRILLPCTDIKSKAVLINFKIHFSLWSPQPLPNHDGISQKPEQQGTICTDTVTAIRKPSSHPPSHFRNMEGFPICNRNRQYTSGRGGI